jgi:hypothetical protein
VGLSLFLAGTMDFIAAPPTTIDADNSFVTTGVIMLG